MNYKTKFEICFRALLEIRQGKGAYSMDRLEHATNVIEESKRIANDAITQVKEEQP